MRGTPHALTHLVRPACCIVWLTVLHIIHTCAAHLSAAADSALAAAARSFFQAWLLLQLGSPGQDLPLPERWKARALQVCQIAVLLLR